MKHREPVCLCTSQVPAEVILRLASPASVNHLKLVWRIMQLFRNRTLEKEKAEEGSAVLATSGTSDAGGSPQHLCPIEPQYLCVFRFNKVSLEALRASQPNPEGNSRRECLSCSCGSFASSCSSVVDFVRARDNHRKPSPEQRLCRRHLKRDAKRLRGETGVSAWNVSRPATDCWGSSLVGGDWAQTWQDSKCTQQTVQQQSSLDILVMLSLRPEVRCDQLMCCHAVTMSVHFHNRKWWLLLNPQICKEAVSVRKNHGVEGAHKKFVKWLKIWNGPTRCLHLLLRKPDSSDCVRVCRSCWIRRDSERHCSAALYSLRLRQNCADWKNDRVFQNFCLLLPRRRCSWKHAKTGFCDPMKITLTALIRNRLY